MVYLVERSVDDAKQCAVQADSGGGVVVLRPNPEPWRAQEAQHRTLRRQQTAAAAASTSTTTTTTATTATTITTTHHICAQLAGGWVGGHADKCLGRAWMLVRDTNGCGHEGRLGTDRPVASDVILPAGGK